MAKTLYEQLLEQISNITENIRNKAMQVYQSIGNKLRSSTTNGNQFMQRDKDRLYSKLQPIHIGRLIAFFYDPKLKQELPYYDRLPLVIPFSFEKDGFRGINFHYLPPVLRARLLDLMTNSSYYKNYDNEKRRIQIRYGILQDICGGRRPQQRRPARNNLFTPCIKKYLYSHVRSRYYVLSPEEWQAAVLLNIERFEKKSAQYVWRESLRKIGQR
jgi:hypothetical protein